ncbi:Armadillo repeat only 2 protein [Zostera marina]|uniref:Armadillo repeat only 2 protein n=1 Tax=Zostera marina TaxID=29655 RepID=A0A0K9PMP5_ZOSMR|nr:Armadillo repeat only 2 protein [Zostera marina]
MADGIKQILARPIQLADQVTKWAEEAQISWQECADLKPKTERLAVLLRQAARASDLYERPTRRIMNDIEQVLDKALSLVSKCRARGLVTRLFTIIPANAFKKMCSQLDNSIADVNWLLRVSKSSSSNVNGGGGNNNYDDDEEDGYLGLPPIASNDPILGFIWEHVAKLTSGNMEEKADAAAALVSLARDNARHRKLIIDEGGIPPLLKLIKEGKKEGQEYAAKTLGLLATNPESVEVMVQAGIGTVFAKVLKEGPMQVQAVIAWAIAELADEYPTCQEAFAQSNVVRLLVGHLAFETVQEHSKYTIHPKSTSIHCVVVANASNAQQKTTTGLIDDDGNSSIKHPLGNHGQNTMNQMHNIVQTTMGKSTSKAPSGASQHQHQHHQNQSQHHQRSSNVSRHHQPNGMSLGGTSIKGGREFEDPETKAYMKQMAARALTSLAKDNCLVCKSITESKALLCFAVLLEKADGEVQSNSAIALMTIARVADKHAELRRSAFKPTSPAAKTVVDQVLKVVELGEYNDLLVPCIIVLGCLARTFRATETRIIGPLVRLLDDREPEVMEEAAIALSKFACTENYLHLDHSKAIIAAGGAKLLVQLVYLGDQEVKLQALALLCYVAFYVPDSEDLAQAEVLAVLEWASKQGPTSVQNQTIETMLPEAKSRLELYQSRGIRGFH